MNRLHRLFSLGVAFAVLAGCYYYEEDYYRAGPGRSPYPSRARGARQDPYAQPAEPAQPGSEWETPAPEPMPEPEPEPGFETDPAAPEPEPEAEPAGDFDFTVRLIGVSPDLKDELEREVRGLDGMESVAVLSYRGGELQLGLRFGGSVRALKKSLEAAARGRAKRFALEASGSGDESAPLKVRIFAPAEGSRLASTTVFVGVEAEGAPPLKVSVNGIPADPLPTAGRFRARIDCRPGENEIIARVEDGAGRTAQAAARVFVADGEPASGDNAPLTVLIQGKVTDPLSTVTVDGKAVKVEPDGTYRAEVVLREGQKEVLVVAVDSLGNKTLRKIPVGGK